MKYCSYTSKTRAHRCLYYKLCLKMEMHCLVSSLFTKVLKTSKKTKVQKQEWHSDICVINSACIYRWEWVKLGCLLSLTASQDIDDAATSSIAHPAIMVKQLQIRRRCMQASAVQISISHAGMLLNPPIESIIPSSSTVLQHTQWRVRCALYIKRK